jgi:hypothetical protein
VRRDRPACTTKSRAIETRQHHCHKPGQVPRARGGRASRSPPAQRTANK